MWSVKTYIANGGDDRGTLRAHIHSLDAADLAAILAEAKEELASQAAWIAELEAAFAAIDPEDRPEEPGPDDPPEIDFAAIKGDDPDDGYVENFDDPYYEVD
jgi:hypothetical protein